MLLSTLVPSTDLKQLEEEGYNIEITQNYIFVYNVPYLKLDGELDYGIIFCSVGCKNVGEKYVPETHVAYFTGEAPHKTNLEPINLGVTKTNIDSCHNNIIGKYQFSFKPSQGYSNFYTKISYYTGALSVHASEKYGLCFPDGKDNNAIISNKKQLFKHPDNNSSRAGISDVTLKFENQNIGIIGLGGTGSYLLDLISKNPVNEIHLYDGDDFLVHNYFRAPGSDFEGVLTSEKGAIKKTDYFKKMYSEMHTCIFSHPKFIKLTEDFEQLKRHTFVFLCIDPVPEKKEIIDFLFENNIPFINTGISASLMNQEKREILGSVSIVAVENQSQEFLKNKIPLYVGENKEDLYNTNIQIAELNSLCAILAVIKWKKICGFYSEHPNNKNRNYISYSSCDDKLNSYKEEDLRE